MLEGESTELAPVTLVLVAVGPLAVRVDMPCVVVEVEGHLLGSVMGAVLLVLPCHHVCKVLNVCAIVCDQGVCKVVGFGGGVDHVRGVDEDVLQYGGAPCSDWVMRRKGDGVWYVC